MNGSRAAMIPGARRRLLQGTVVAAAAVFLLGSAAWACTQRVGTMTVCRPPSTTYISGGQCGKVTSVTQTGTPTVYKAGSTISVDAKNFYAKRYQVTFRSPNSTSSCHNPAQPGVSVLTDITSGNTTFLGPTFYMTATTPPQTSTGLAKICAEDVPDVITGQIINLSVI